MFFAIVGLVVLTFVAPWFVGGYRLPVACVLMSAATAMYFYYESLIPPRMNIRIDLLILYPLLALGWLLAVILAVWTLAKYVAKK